MPIFRILKHQLPLAYLDALPEASYVPSRMLFRSAISNLQNDGPREAGSHVLIARPEANERLYAVERIEEDAYLACLLAPWVTEDYFRTGHQVQTPKELLNRLLARQQLFETSKSSRRDGRDGDTVAAVRGSPRKPKNPRGILARMSILQPSRLRLDGGSQKAQEMGRPSQVEDVDEIQSVLSQPSNIIESVTEDAPITADISTAICSEHDGSAAPLLDESGAPQETGDVSGRVTDPQEIFTNLRRHYLETLYLSKTPLAYFAKGPLARARSQFLASSSLDPRLYDLADFYRESIIPSKKLDLKYRDSISQILQASSSPHTPSRAAGLGASSKQKGSKLRKIGKDGLYPTEKEFVIGWWHGARVKGTSHPTADSHTLEMKSLIAYLRHREIEMQILLGLEALALESTWQARAMDKVSDSAAKQDPSGRDDKSELANIPRTIKKKRDLRSELDLLVDRLCIWHTVSIGETLNSLDEKQVREGDPDSRSKDKLRDFCTDVVVPFYASRLPEQAKAICLKLGGPEISPKRSRSAMTKASKPPRVPPHVAFKGERGLIPRPTLERVLSEDQGLRHASPPVLARSCITTSIPNVKRESTEPGQRPDSRGGMQRSASFANREVDLVADARCHVLKRRKLANLAQQKQELDAAISALKRPNRGRAAQEIFEEWESRKVVAKDPAKRSRLGVQVDATPKKGAVIGANAGKDSSRPARTVENDLGLSAHEISIPSSTTRPCRHGQGDVNPRPFVEGQAAISAVHETPSRGSMKKSDPLGLLTSSRQLSSSHLGLSGHASPVQATPPDSRPGGEMVVDVQNTPMRMLKSHKPVAFTPLKRSQVVVEDLFKDALEIPEKACQAMDRVMGNGRELSIYDSLGWNDDFDDLA